MITLEKGRQIASCAFPDNGVRLDAAYSPNDEGTFDLKITGMDFTIIGKARTAASADRLAHGIMAVLEYESMGYELRLEDIALVPYEPNACPSNNWGVLE